MDDINYTPSSLDADKETKAPSTDALSDMIGRLMSNPEVMKIISSMAGKSQKTTEESPNDESDVSVSVSENASALTDTSTKLPDVISALSPMLSGIASLKSDKPPKLSPKDERRACLLRAIKPYVSHGRSEAIDYMIQLSRITELMKNLN